MTRQSLYLLMGLLVSIGLMIMMPATLCADLPVLPPTPATPSQVGVVAAVQGTVSVGAPGVVGRVVASGQPVYLGEVVKTDAGGHLQILLLDETIFTIGPNSAMAIDTFVYDPATAKGQVGARVVQGVFRFITGKIARREPSAMAVKLPVGIIGIRGTVAAGRVEGERAQVVLLGPGPRNNTGDPPGRVLVTGGGDGAAQGVVLTRPSYGTTIPGLGQAPTPPALVPAAELAAMTGALAPAAEAESGGGNGEGGTVDEGAEEGSASEESGQSAAEGLESFSDTDTLAGTAEGLENSSTVVAQQAAKQTGGIADGIATKDHLRTIQTGQFHYTINGGVGSFVQTSTSGTPVHINGTVSALINIDFGARTFGGTGPAGSSYVTVNTTSYGGSISQTDSIDAQSFASGTGNAVFTGNGSSTYLTGSFTLKNSGGTVAAKGTLDVTYDTFPVLGNVNRQIGSTLTPVEATRDPS